MPWEIKEYYTKESCLLELFLGLVLARFIEKCVRYPNRTAKILKENNFKKLE